uniref:Cytochrome P450 2K1-like n=1 Tax=Neogobius melanostomus TaxID=47308 RepID=A0A8C6TK87_9GOBI
MGFTDALLSSPGTVLGAVLVLLLFYLFYGLGSDQGPPGPRPFPVVGNLLQLDLKQPYNTLMEYSKQYGSVFTVWLGPKKVVVLAGYKTVKEALVDNADVFGDRDPLPILTETMKKDKYGVIWSNHELWREVRRFALTNLRDYGMGKRACEDKITEEAQYLCDVFKNFKGKPLDTTQPMNQAVSNIICSMVYGSRFEYDDPKFVALVSDANRIIQIAGSPSVQIYNLFPWLGRLVSRIRTGSFQELEGDAKPQMCRGFVDSFLIRQKKEEGVPDSPFDEDNLLQTVLQLFNAGTDTTATTLRWGLLIMAKYPHLQDQVREEISRVIGSRQVLIEDRKDLPFTDAVIHETQRIANIVPMAIPHRTSQDITFQGHFIKKGTTVFPLLTSVLYDESQWEKPHSFHPAHFLDKDGKFVKRDAFMPFSAGRRICLGEGLARMELFIFFVTLMQRFRFTAPPGVSEEELELVPRVGFTLNPTAHELCAVPCL